VTRLRAGRSGVRIPAGTKLIPSLKEHFGCGAHTGSYSMGTTALSWGRADWTLNWPLNSFQCRP